MSQPAFHPLDEQLASLMYRLAGATDTPDLGRLVRYVSARTREGVIAAPLSELPEFDPEPLLDLPVVGRAGDYKPLIIEDGHAWLYRYWQYEERLAGRIQKRMGEKATLEKTADLQQLAVNLAIRQNFLIISGGPGTGKTTTVTRILAHLLEQGTDPKRILLAAPTGKAAMRMQESVRHSKQHQVLPASIAENIPELASTLHRLLGYIPNHVGFRHNIDNPLPADVVIVDEASMVDISLMTHLFEAVPLQAKLILLGDKDQLASVETGSIFRDLCSGPALAGNMVVLQKSHRFTEEDGIGQLAQAIRAADEERLFDVLGSAHYPDVSLDDTVAGLDAASLRTGWERYVQAVQTGDHDAVFNTFNELRILTPLRKGRQGVESLNVWVDKVMQKLLPATSSWPWYAGRPVMITQNDYRQNLFNGDIGIALPTSSGELRVCFPTGEAGKFRTIAPIRLPQHETAWAMTIHKSQGSEFHHVLLILPEMEDLPLLGRELLYTAVTRAKTGIRILASRKTLALALQQVTPPSSRLQERLLM